MKKTYKKIIKCRLCKNQTKKEIDLPNTAIGNDLKKSVKSSLNIKEYPLTVNSCIVCNHLIEECIVNIDKLDNDKIKYFLKRKSNILY